MGLLDFLRNLLSPQRGSDESPALNHSDTRPKTADASPSQAEAPATPAVRIRRRRPLLPRQLGSPPTFRRLMAALRLSHVRVRRVMHSKAPYHTFTIAKHNGSLRDIAAPCRSLRHIQRRILRRIVEPLDTHLAVHGFRRGRCSLTGARRHVGKEAVLAMDLQDFFPSITSQRVYGLFRKLGWPPNLASVLTRLSTWQGRLPQGAPTSPALANLIARRMDRRLAGLARHRGIYYTRYADDLTFSGPADAVRSAIPAIRMIVKEEGFRPAEHKTRLMRCGRRQVVTGLVVNRQVSVPRDYRRRVRAALHGIRTGRTTFATPADRATTLRELEGHVQYIRSIRPEHGDPLAADLYAAETGQ
ncbi:MAG: RNA-directed DNA polymerase [Phycisphaerae bacterium]|nr:RNA-directed DNA polymerase [Phycisphaerae bacterium]